VTARSTFESNFWEALAIHGRAIADGTPTRMADNAFADRMLKAADRYASGAECADCLRAAETALRSADPPAVQAERRMLLDIAVSEHDVSRRQTAGVR
jgi:hypothetical protein